MPVRSSGLALLAVVSTAVALTACSSAGTGKASATASDAATSTVSGASTGTASGAASTGAATTGTAAAGAVVPAGDQRAGGSAQGISIAVPKSWISLNLAKQTLASAAKKLDVPGVDAATLEQEMQSLQKDHAIFAYDIASAASSPQHFTRNLSAYCQSSGITETGRAGVPFLQEGIKSELDTVATGVTQEDVTVGGVPGVETAYKLKSGSGADLYGAQLEVLPKPDVGCFVTLSWGGGQTQGNYLAVAAATAQFP
jgi:hypothetical protein